MLSLINQIIVNLSLIVSTVLTCYFLGLKRSSSKRFSGQFSDLTKISPLETMIFGIFIGFASLFLSSNEIIVAAGFEIDMRYVFVFFSVIYGNILLGETTTSILIVGKTIEYLIDPTIDPISYFNNLILTLLLLLTSILIKRYNLSLKKSILYFMLVFTVTRLLFFLIYLNPILEASTLIGLGIYFLVFSLIFLVTILIINMAVSVASTVNLYRTDAVTDDLTGLYNRRMFSGDLNDPFHYLSKAEVFCLAILDIDDFKIINDRYSHHVGDLVLKHFSILLRENFPLEDGQIYRIGGEEFAFLTFHTKEETIKKLEKFRHSLSQTPLYYKEQLITVSTSIGMTQFKQTAHSNTYEEITAIYSRADQALYEAKRTGKNKLVTL